MTVRDYRIYRGDTYHPLVNNYHAILTHIYYVQCSHLTGKVFDELDKIKSPLLYVFSHLIGEKKKLLSP